MCTKEVKSRYHHAGVEGMTVEPIPEFLGNADATDEWTITKREVAKSNFINIESYEKFSDPSCIILAGRIGSGKTTMLHMLSNTIEQEKNGRYSSSVIIDSRDYIAQLGITIRASKNAEYAFTEIEHIARTEWEKMLNILAMQTLYYKFAENHPNDFKKIEAFLRSEQIIHSDHSVTNTLKILADNLKGVNSSFIQNSIAAINCFNSVNFSTYYDALEEFHNLLSQFGPFLILVDSIEKYEFKDPVILAILNALVNLSIEYSRNNKFVDIKIAVPSELIPKLLTINAEKITSKVVYIRWSHNDLKKFIAVRIYKFIKKLSEDRFVDRDEAVAFFDEYYEETCETRCGFRFPTFPYCMTYTQKEPRQMLSIFNAWLYYENKFPNSPRMSLIGRAITYDELSRLKGALSIYSSVHPRMFEMFQRTFDNRKYCFSEQEFDEWINTCSGIRSNQIDAYDLKQYFISSGLVGTMVEMHEIKSEHSVLKNNRDIRIKEVIFEYQYKECLPFNSQTRFCLHPMVFSALNIEIDSDTFVYPKPLELDGEFTPWIR